MARRNIDFRTLYPDAGNVFTGDPSRVGPEPTSTFGGIQDFLSKSPDFELAPFLRSIAPETPMFPSGPTFPVPAGIPPDDPRFQGLPSPAPLEDVAPSANGALGLPPDVRRVQTQPIVPGQMPGQMPGAPGGPMLVGAPPAGAPGAGAPGVGGQRQKLMDMYMKRMEAALKPAKPESKSEMIGRMLMNFGMGTAAGASNISGRSVGPSTLEAIAGGTTSLAKGEMSEKDKRAAAAAKRGKGTTSMLEKMIGYHTGLEKEQRAKSDKAFDRWAKKRQLDISAKKGGRKSLAQDMLSRLGPAWIAAGNDPADLVPQIQLMVEAARNNPDKAQALGLE